MAVQTVKSGLGHMMGKNPPKKRRIRVAWVISLTNVCESVMHSGTIRVYSLISSVSPTKDEKNKNDVQKDVEGTEAVITADRRRMSRVQIRAGGGGNGKKSRLISLDTPQRPLKRANITT